MRADLGSHLGFFSRVRWNPIQDFCVGGAGSHPELLVGLTGFHSKIWAGYYVGSSEIPLRILDWDWRDLASHIYLWHKGENVF